MKGSVHFCLLGRGSRKYPECFPVLQCGPSARGHSALQGDHQSLREGISESQSWEHLEVGDKEVNLKRTLLIVGMLREACEAQPLSLDASVNSPFRNSLQRLAHARFLSSYHCPDAVTSRQFATLSASSLVSTLGPGHILQISKYAAGPKRKRRASGSRWFMEQIFGGWVHAELCSRDSTTILVYGSISLNVHLVFAAKGAGVLQIGEAVQRIRNPQALHYWLREVRERPHP